MAQKGTGWIVNVSGGGATAPRPQFAAYAAAKTALVRFGETLAAECQGTGVRVNSIAPGAFRSGMTDRVLAAIDTAGPDEIATAGRLLKSDSGAAEKAAALVGYLTCGDGRNITGQLISAVWDDWQALHGSEIKPDHFTLRRMVPPA